MKLTHQQAMQLAIDLAKQGQYSTQPNPRVGCVIVKDGEIVGQGVHLKAGELHAERHALLMAGDKAKGATCYVTLEPCSHHGRTPPCCDALIEHQVAKVVVAMTDPNPLVSGRGIKKLQAASIAVETGLLEAQALDLNRGFITRMRENRPYVRVKLAMSLDGKTAMIDGQSKWLTGPEARLDVQKWRARSCAVITGSNTVKNDDPSLNVRWSTWTDEVPDAPYQLQPKRVIVDSKAQTPANINMLALKGDTLLATCSDDDNLKQRWQAAKGQWLKTQAKQDKVDLKSLLAQLAEQQCNEVLVEAGSKLCGAFAEQGLVDEYLIYVAPKLLGENTMGLMSLPQIDNLDAHKKLNFIDVTTIGDDIRIRAVAADINP
jgi:diaminohydroxyphosphoribosylaminopyrimidine deaminase/5-amino-6-(5-phosphoribosylamino)uracil reductase